MLYQAKDRHVSGTTNLVKLCVGAESVEDLIAWRAAPVDVPVEERPAEPREERKFQTFLATKTHKFVRI